jgi:hypothetical protein
MRTSFQQPDLRAVDGMGEARRLSARRDRRVRLTLPSATLPLFHAWRP